MKVSINLVTWNGKKYLPYCLESIAKQTFRDFSLLILDNGSTDGTRDYLKNIQYPVSNTLILFNEKNVGFAAGHNQAIRLTNSEYVLMLNQDVVLEPNFLEVIVKFLDSHSKIGAATGKLLQWDAENDKKTNQLDSCGLKIFKNHRMTELGAGEADSEKWSEPQEVFGVSGAVPVYRRKALEDAAILRNFALQSAPIREYFDEDFFSYKEDVDLAYRLRLAGWQAWFLPQARAYHDRTAVGSGKSDKEVVRHRRSKSMFINYHSYKNHLFFLIKNVPAGIWWRYGYRIKWYEFKKFIYLLFFERATLKSLGEFFRKLPMMYDKRKQIMAIKHVKNVEIAKWLR